MKSWVQVPMMKQRMKGKNAKHEKWPVFTSTSGCGVFHRVQRVTCVASSVTHHFTLSMPHFSNSQWGTEKQLNLLDVNITHSVPGNTCWWYSTTAQHLNLDFYGRCAGTGSAMGFTLYDRTVNLDNVMGDPLIIYSTALLSYSYAPCTVKLRFFL